MKRLVVECQNITRIRELESIIDSYSAMVERNTREIEREKDRVGIATGSVVGSVVGVQKYVYDIFGYAVNLASRLQLFAGPMSIVAHDEM